MTSEYLQFDDEDQENLNARSRISPYGPAEDPYNNRIYYCYYEPSKMYILTTFNTQIFNKTNLQLFVFEESSVIYLWRFFGIIWCWVCKLLARSLMLSEVNRDLLEVKSQSKKKKNIQTLLLILRYIISGIFLGEMAQN